MESVIPSLILQKRILVCVGGGGVGKTTIAASLGLAASGLGKRTVVLTVDPSRRLRDLMHLPEGTGPQELPLPRERYPGSLHAFIPSPQKTMDCFIQSLSPSTELADRVLKSRFYQKLSGNLADLQSYVVSGQIPELALKKFDLVVLDTPPSSHALDFLKAPLRLASLVTSQALDILKNPSLILLRSGSRLAKAALSAVLRRLETLLGSGFLRDTAEFLEEAQGLAPGLRERVQQALHLLRDDQTALVLVAAPDPFSLPETLSFARKIQEEGFPLCGLVINRLLPLSTGRSALSLPRPCPLLEKKLLSLYRDMRAWARYQRKTLKVLAEEAPSLPLLAVVPALEKEPLDFPLLEEISQHLCSGVHSRRFTGRP